MQNYIFLPYENRIFENFRYRVGEFSIYGEFSALDLGGRHAAQVGESHSACSRGVLLALMMQCQSVTMCGVVGDTFAVAVQIQLALKMPHFINPTQAQCSVG